MRIYCEAATTLAILACISTMTTTTRVQANHVVSGSTAKLPMSLSSVINDLEAEGAKRITTAAFLTSRGVTKSQRSTLLRTLFGVTGEGDHDEEVSDGSTTAFGKKYHGPDDDVHTDHDSEDEDEDGIGMAIANPLTDASIAQVAATVQACGGSIVYLVSIEDLMRGESLSLFQKLAPAIERIVNVVSEDDNDNETGNDTNQSENEEVAASKTLVVVVDGATTQSQLQEAKTKLEAAASDMLANIVQNSPIVITSLSQVFDSIHVVPSGGPIDNMLCQVGGFSDPSAAASNVAKAILDSTAGDYNPFSPSLDDPTTSVAALHKSPLNLAAVRKLLPASRLSLDHCLSTVKKEVYNSGEDGSSSSSSSSTTPTLVSNFGELCDAAIAQALSTFDTTAGPKLLQSSPIAKTIRSDLIEAMYDELSILYQQQMSLLQQASFEQFQSGLSKLRLGPNLASDMNDVAKSVLVTFESSAKKLYHNKKSASASVSSSWPSFKPNVANLATQLKEYIHLRLLTAKANGKYRPLPRKGVTLGFHWLLPKPFGNDYRMEPWEVHAKDDLVYVPEDGITDLGKEGIVRGDWRSGVVPSPTANEMIYMK